MARSVDEWIGKTDDTPIPPRVRLRVFERERGLCHNCRRKINAGERWTLEHLKALINGGENRESNLGCTCCNCLHDKNAEDVREKAITYRKRSKHLGIRKPKRPFPGSKAHHLKKKADGTVVDRRTGKPVTFR